MLSPSSTLISVGSAVSLTLAERVEEMKLDGCSEFAGLQTIAIAFSPGPKPILEDDCLAEPQYVPDDLPLQLLNSLASMAIS
jgi:hypothetical protein